MFKKKQFKMSQRANKIINLVLKQRIPFFHEIHLDDNQDFVSQADFYGNTDSLISVDGERIYQNQNKSRNNDREDIAIECKSHRGKFYNAEYQEVPLEGAYWYETGKCWLTPYWAGAETLSYYIPNKQFIGHFSRYFLDIMFSKRETWESMTGIYKDKNENNKYLAFFNYKDFCNMYMQTIACITYGEEAIK